MLIKPPKIKCHKNPFTGSRVVPCGQTWRSKVAFRKFTKLLKTMSSHEESQKQIFRHVFVRSDSLNCFTTRSNEKKSETMPASPSHLFLTHWFVTCLSTSFLLHLMSLLSCYSVECTLLQTTQRFAISQCHTTVRVFWEEQCNTERYAIYNCSNQVIW